MTLISEPQAARLRPPRSNPILTRADWEAQREAFLKDPGGFFGEIARQILHWYDRDLNAWITWDAEAQQWHGLDAATGTPIDVPYTAEHQVWERSFNADHAPFYRWFEGGLTNACFNEVDRHVMMGYGDEVAYYFEGDRWDSTLNDGRGGPVVSYPVTRKKLLLEVVKAAQVLRDLGLKRGDRLALNMPNIMEQIYYTEAAKRLGIIYTPVFGGFSDKTLSDRIHNAGARIVITSDGGYRNAQVVPYKETYTDQALDKFIPVEVALEIVQTTLDSFKEQVQAHHLETIFEEATAAVEGDITVERRDIMRGVGRALDQLADVDTLIQSRIRTAIAQALVESPPRVDAVVVVRHTGQDIVWRTERDRWSHSLMTDALLKILENARDAGINVQSEQELAALPTEQFIRALYATSPAEPLDAEFPMFIIYTSGSTGKPKGVVHVHGGYTAGVAYTMRISFDSEPGDTIFVVADPGWITGQSYLLSATMSTRCTGVIAEGSPVFPSAGRFSSMIERYGVNIFKAGVTFLKSVMSDPQNVADVQFYDMSSLRVCTFCAEPVSPAVQQFGMDLMSPQYINSYWATEHGGIVWTHFYGNDDFPLRPDAHTYPLPWVLGEVWIAAESSSNGSAAGYQIAPFEEKGEIVITHPYPYLTRTIWGDVENFTIDGDRINPAWQGDLERYVKTYWRRGPVNASGEEGWGYIQGDFARKYADGSFSLHGRSDDVINVSGHRMGTEEIEGAILRDQQQYANSPVGNCIVVGAPHREKGLTPVAFILTVPGRTITSEDRRRLNELVRNEKGVVSVPEDYIEVSAFPETRSGKYMRRFLRAMMLDEPLGDTTTLRNPESLEEIGRKIQDWKLKQRLAEEQRLFENYRYFRIEYHPAKQLGKMAVVTVTNPPVNALNERALDELNTLLDHLARREDVVAIVFTGQGTKSFVAGADIRQLLEEMHSYEDAIALPNNAQLAFRKIERMPKPCIAAINGVALGGGMEFAMACHARVADMHAIFGQPEINLRLLPGYGGTQRLLRLVQQRHGEHGIVDALKILMNGRNLTADEVMQLGLVDMVAYDDQHALTLATQLVLDYAANAEHAPDSSALAQMFRTRQSLNEQWEQPDLEFAAKIEQAFDAPEIQRVVAQAEWAGRSDAIRRIKEAVLHGYTHGMTAGLAYEARMFAEAVVDPEGGKRGIQDFLDKKAAPLPTRRVISTTPEFEQELIAKGQLLPVGAPFFPGITPIPTYQYAQGALRDEKTGTANHGDPIVAEKQFVIPVERPNPNQVLLYVLASEVNFNDIWAITGIPVSQFDNHDRDWHVTGSGGIGLVAALGEEARREGRLNVGDVVSIFSGQSNLLSPLAGIDPMYVDFFIQGNETPDGSHQQFMLVQAPQCLPMLPDLTIEAAGSYVLSMGTVYRALFTVLDIKPGYRIFIEGSATGTGADAMTIALNNNLHVTGMVSSNERAGKVRERGATGVINRRDPRYDSIFTRVPSDPTQWAAWEAAGDALLEDYRAQNHGHLADYVVSHAGERSFPRSFQLLGEPHDNHIPTLTFYGASSGYHFTFMGKPGAADPETMLRRVRMRAGEAVVIYYGVVHTEELVDQVGLEAIETARAMGGRIVIVTASDAQRDFILSLGFGAALQGVISLEEIKRRSGDDFEWHTTMPDLADARTETEAFKEGVRRFTDLTFKPLGAAIGRFLRSPDNPRGYPDLIIERAGHDALAVSTMLVKPFTGRVVYYENMSGRRYSFYAPQVWTRHRRIYMPSANIWGTHLSNAAEVAKLNDDIAAGLLQVGEPVVVAWEEIAEAHQAMWENRLTGAIYVVNHALPRTGLTSKDELYQAWAEQM